MHSNKHKERASGFAFEPGCIENCPLCSSYISVTQKKYPNALVSNWCKYTMVDVIQSNSSRSKHLITRRIVVWVFHICVDARGWYHVARARNQCSCKEMDPQRLCQLISPVQRYELLQQMSVVRFESCLPCMIKQNRNHSYIYRVLHVPKKSGRNSAKCS